jgi:uncharacterized membrane protein
MGHAGWWIILVGVAVLLIVLLALVIKNRPNRDKPELDRDTAEGTRELYADEEIRRREGTDNL